MFKAKIGYNNIRWIEPTATEPTIPGTTIDDVKRIYDAHYRNASISVDPSTFDDTNAFWVDSEFGSNANPGTNALPFKTIEYALSKIIGRPKEYIVLKGRIYEERLKISGLPTSNVLIISSQSGTAATIQCPSDYPSTYIDTSLDNRSISSMVSYNNGFIELWIDNSHVGKSETIRCNYSGTPTNYHRTFLFLPNLRVNNTYSNLARQAYCYDGSNLQYSFSSIPDFHYLKTVQKNPFREQEIDGLLQRFDRYSYSIDPNESEIKQLYWASLDDGNFEFDWTNTTIRGEPSQTKGDSIKFIVDICRNNRSPAPYIMVTAETKKDGSECYLVFWKAVKDYSTTNPTNYNLENFGEKELDGSFPVSINTVSKDVFFNMDRHSLYSANDNYYYFGGSKHAFLIDNNLSITELTSFDIQNPRKIVYHKNLEKYFCITGTSGFPDIWMSENGIDFVPLGILERNVLPIDIIIMNNVIFVSTYEHPGIIQVPISGNSEKLYYSYNGIDWFDDYEITEPNWGLYENNGRLGLLACCSNNLSAVPAYQSFQESLINNELADTTVFGIPSTQHILDNIILDGANNCGRIYTEGNKTNR